MFSQRVVGGQQPMESLQKGRDVVHHHLAQLQLVQAGWAQNQGRFGNGLFDRVHIVHGAMLVFTIFQSNVMQGHSQHQAGIQVGTFGKRQLTLSTNLKDGQDAFRNVAAAAAVGEVRVEDPFGVWLVALKHL
jgi:hypothetical protein